MMKSFIFIVICLFAFNFSWAQTYFSSPNIVSAGLIDDSWTCTAGDVDGDGDIDLLAGSAYSNLVWFENLDGMGHFGPGTIISANPGELISLYLADLDGDGDLDLLAALGCNGTIIWYKNLDGHGTFSTAILITASLASAHDARAADIDGDGNPDIICASYEDGYIAWFKNLDGHGNFGPEQVISTNIEGAECVWATDLDSDGDPDVISGAYIGNIIAWYENKDGQGTFNDEQMITDSVDGPMSIFVADLDGDGDKDVLTASRYDGKVAWYQNLDGKGDFGPQRLLTDSIGGPTNVFACDIDNDGDIDVVATTMWDDQVFWFENLDGHGNFGPMQIITSGFDFPSSLFAADLDGDGDPDIIATSYNSDILAWFQNVTLKILMQPQNVSFCTGQPASFSTTAKDYTGFRWQVSRGTGFSDLSDNSDYTGTATSILQISFADSTMSGNKYRCRVFNSRFTLYTDEVTLIVADHTPPIISNYPQNQIVYAGSNCKAILSDYTQSAIVTDNCDSVPTLAQYPTPGTVISGVVNVITLTAMDHAKNISSVSFNIEVLDTLAPVINCAQSNTIELKHGEDSYVVKGHEFDPVNYTDNCAVESVMNDLNHSETLDYQHIPPGTTTVTWQITDKSGNHTQCHFTITVNRGKWGINLYPNPTPGKLFLEFNRDDITQILLFDPEGKPLLEKPVLENIEEIDLSNLPEGLYIVRIKAQEEIIIRKIVRMN